ncbi:MAG: peptidase, partial [Oligoflexia bacterium]|nr:peptidase [Oligoflexia bacterium]
MKTEKTPIIDGHSDVLTNLWVTKRDFFKHGTQGQLDLPRAQIGGLKCG